MSSDALATLRAELGADPPSGVGALAEDRLEDLAAAVRTARKQQSEALATAAQHALDHIPRPLRGAVKRALGA
jgi:hypothetical protein